MSLARTSKVRSEHEIRVFTEGHKLLRMLMRTYYDQIYCIVIDAFLNMCPRGERVNEETLAKELQLQLQIVHEPLNQLAMTYILKMTREDRNAVEERQAALMGGNSVQQTQSTVIGVASSSLAPQANAKPATGYAVRSRKPVLFWEVDYEQLVNVIKYRHETILRKFEKRVELALTCPNASCPMYKKPVTFEDAVMKRAIRRATATNSALGTVRNTWGSNENANLDKLLCEVELCSTELVEQSEEIDTLTELKKLFNEQLKPLNEQTSLVERLLYERRELRDAAIAGGEHEKIQAAEEARQAALEAERARASEITDEERRQRELVRGAFLLQDDATAEEIQMREEQLRVLRQKEESEKASLVAAEKRKQEEDAYERELAAIYERQRKQELELELLKQAQAQTAAATAAQEASLEPVKLEVLGSDALPKEEWGDGWGVDAKGWGTEGETAASGEEVHVYVNGEKLPLSAITQEHLDQMTDEELTEYERVSEMYRGSDSGHLASFFDSQTTTKTEERHDDQNDYQDYVGTAGYDEDYL